MCSEKALNPRDNLWPLGYRCRSSLEELFNKGMSCMRPGDRLAWGAHVHDQMKSAEMTNGKSDVLSRPAQNRREILVTNAPRKLARHGEYPKIVGGHALNTPVKQILQACD
jgi:hypothetical protein